VVLRQVGGRTFSLESAGMIAGALRDELIRRHGPGAPEWLTGHPPGSAEPSRRRRPAIFPLGFVGREYADGHLLGVGIALPADDFTPADTRLLFGLLARHDEPADVAAEGVGFVRLAVPGPARGGVVGELLLELDERPAARRAYALQPETWTRPACLWVTVTPAVLPRFTKKRLTAAQVISQACVDAGYPEPVSVQTSLAPAMSGVPHARSFHRPVKSGRPPRPLTHAVLHFDGPVRGPLLLGAGRYAGFGLCRSLGCGYDEAQNVCRIGTLAQRGSRS
ncbi:MAG TPA: type I-U CRISPR-associated protein Csb2, partial [Gemmataceae bacterium]|nr:type I-U CRISPR-associated protein Csb2 [Gemmataceae bacterium]